MKNSSTQSGFVQFGRSRIAFDLRRGDRKDIAITVMPDGTVLVTAPQTASCSLIENAVRGRASWVVRQQDWLRRHYPRRPRQFVSGESFLYLGRQYQLRIIHKPMAATGVSLVAGQFRVSLPAELSGEKRCQTVRSMLVSWYREHALIRLEELAARMAPKVGVSYVDLRILDMPTRWGSGGPNGRLRFNWRTAMAPVKLAEYVVAHELAHILHSSHSTAFWSTLSRVMPDWRDRVALLEIRGPTFDF